MSSVTVPSASVVSRTLVGGERADGSDEAAVTLVGLHDDVVARGPEVLGLRVVPVQRARQMGHRPAVTRCRGDRRRAAPPPGRVARRLATASKPANDGDGQQHEEQLVPAALVGEDCGHVCHHASVAGGALNRAPSGLRPRWTAASATAIAQVERMAARRRTSRSATSCAITRPTTWPSGEHPDLRPSHPGRLHEAVVDRVVDRAEQVPAPADRVGEQGQEVLTLEEQEREVVGEEPTDGDRARARRPRARRARRAAPRLDLARAMRSAMRRAAR